MERPLADLGFGAQELPKCRARILGHDWAVGVRLGPSANDTLPQTLQMPTPAPGKFPLGGGSTPTGSPWADWIPSVHEDGSLEYAILAYQSSWATFHHCGAGKAIRVRLEGEASPGHGAGSPDVPQRAKAGYCPCCTVPTHIATPRSYEAGVFDPL